MTELKMQFTKNVKLPASEESSKWLIPVLQNSKRKHLTSIPLLKTVTATKVSYQIRRRSSFLVAVQTESDKASNSITAVYTAYSLLRNAGLKRSWLTVILKQFPPTSISRISCISNRFIGNISGKSSNMKNQ